MKRIDDYKHVLNGAFVKKLRTEKCPALKKTRTTNNCGRVFQARPYQMSDFTSLGINVIC